VLLRLAYLGVTNVFALLRLLPMSNQDKDAEILALRHQVLVLQRQLDPGRVRFTPADRAMLAALLNRFPEGRAQVTAPGGETGYRAPLAPRHAGAPARPPVPAPASGPTADRALDPRPGAAAGPLESRVEVSPGSWRAAGARVKVVASTVWEILREAGIDPAPERGSATWADFLRSQAEALLACDFFEVVTLSGARLHVLAVIEHASRRIRILSATARPTVSWVAQAARNLAMDLEDAGCRARFLIRDRDGKFPGLFDVILADAGIKTCT
jgi:putative transposase